MTLQEFLELPDIEEKKQRFVGFLEKNPSRCFGYCQTKRDSVRMILGEDAGRIQCLTQRETFKM